jgi:hypothetical protein
MPRIVSVPLLLFALLLPVSDPPAEAQTTCSPLACSEILVDLPYELNFNSDHGKILDANSVGTGFTYIDQPTNGTGYLPQNLTVNTAGAGTLNVATTKGIMFTGNNSQDNALSVGIAAPNQISVLKTTLLNPPAGSGNYEQGGLWFGNDEDNYVKLEVLSTPTGTVIEYFMEVNGSVSAQQQTGTLNLSSSKVALSLRANPNDRTIAASYQLNGGSTVELGTFTAPGEFFSFDAAGIDPNIRTRSFGGIYATHRNGSTPLSYTFDDFSVTAENVPPPGQDLAFDRSSFPVPNPTSMVWGPDGRLYVTELFGKIHALTLNDNKQVVNDEVITTLGSRLTLGITVDPLSTASNVILWVSHSNPSADNGQLNSSTVTRLSGSARELSSHSRRRSSSPTCAPRALTARAPPRRIPTGRRRATLSPTPLASETCTISFSTPTGPPTGRTTVSASPARIHPPRHLPARVMVIRPPGRRGAIILENSRTSCCGSSKASTTATRTLTATGMAGRPSASSRMAPTRVSLPLLTTCLLFTNSEHTSPPMVRSSTDLTRLMGR